MKKILVVSLILSLLLGLSFAEKNSAATAGQGNFEISAELNGLVQQDPSDPDGNGGVKNYVSKYNLSNLGVVYGINNELDVGLGHSGMTVESIQNTKPREYKHVGISGTYVLSAKYKLMNFIPLTDATSVKFETTLKPRVYTFDNAGAEDITFSSKETAISLLASKSLDKKLTIGAGLGISVFKNDQPSDDGWPVIVDQQKAIIYSFGADYMFTDMFTGYVSVAGRMNSDKVGKVCTDGEDNEAVQKANGNIGLIFGLKYDL
jgi:hypothetical protein